MRRRMRRLIFPCTVFVAVFGIHLLWMIFFPDSPPAQQSQWVSFSDNFPKSALSIYLQTQSYFLGYTYALSIAYVAFSLRRYVEAQNRSSERNPLIGGIGLSGMLSLSSCFLIGCCGSPMLAVYLSWFGAKFLPYTKPLIAALSTLIIAGIWLKRAASASAKSSCGCH